MSNEVFRSRSQNSQNRSTHIVRWLTLAAALVALSVFNSTYYGGYGYRGGFYRGGFGHGFHR